MARNCIICGKDISDTPTQRKICYSPKCKRELYKKWYNNKLIDRQCNLCNQTFKAKNNQYYCPLCRKELRKQERLIFKNKNTFDQQVICTDCGELIEIVKKVHNGMESQITYSKCPKCKEYNKNQWIEKMSKRMLSDQNPSIVKYGRSIPTPPRDPAEISLQRSLHMKINNPMFNPKTRKKVGDTLKKKIANGEITIKKWTENSRNKLQQDIYGLARLEIKSWVKNCLIRDNFKCSICNSKGELHVHHTEPFKDIVNRITKKYLGDDTTYRLKFDYNDPIHKQLIEEIVEYHNSNLNIGITVCPKCHSNIDPQYREYKNK